MGKYDDFIEIVKSNIHLLHENNKTRKEVETHLEKYGISKGELQKYFNNTYELDDADIRTVALIGEQIFAKTNLEKVNLQKHFSKNEIKEIHEYYNFFEDDFIDYPIVLQDVTMVNDGEFYFNLSYQFVAQLYNSHKLNYNYDVQRSPKYRKRKNEVVKTPFINQKSVNEITEHLLNGTLVSTSLAYNVALGSSDSPEDIIYNSRERTLTINDGARIDILDGMHRTLACVRAYAENKNLNFNFRGAILNYNTKMAQIYQSQLAKANPIPKSRTKELAATRYADFIVKQLRLDSELKDRITSNDRPKLRTKELVSYGVLSDAIDANFEIKNKMEAMEVYKYLSEYFMYLLGYFEESHKLEKGNLMFYNKMFIGHIRLAKRMREKHVPLSNLNKILAEIDFNRDSKILEKFEIVTDKQLTNKIEKSITRLFDSISLDA